MSLARPLTRVSLSRVWQLFMTVIWQPSAFRSLVASWCRSCREEQACTHMQSTDKCCDTSAFYVCDRAIQSLLLQLSVIGTRFRSS